MLRGNVLGGKCPGEEMSRGEMSYTRLRSTVVERWSLTDEHFLPRPALELQQLTGDHYVGEPSLICQPTRPTQPFILSGSINE